MEKIWVFGFALLCVVAKSGLAAQEPIPTSVPNHDVKKRINSGYSLSPILGYDPTYGALLGGAVFRGHTDPPLSNSSVFAYATLKKIFAIEFKTKIWDAERSYYLLELSTGNFFDPYYGEGDRTDPNNELDIQSYKITAAPSVGYRFDENLSLVGYSKIKYRDELGTESDPLRRVFGTQMQPVFGLTVIHDDRDNQVLTTKGHYLSLLGQFGPSALSTKGGSQDFFQVEGDFRHFISPVPWLVLGGQARGGISFGNAGFLFRYSLGGNDTLRGFHNNRIRGASYYLTQIESRFQIVKWLYLVGFISAGDTSDNGASNFNGPLVSKGAGLRLALPPDFVARARLDIGFASDQSSIFLNFNEAF